MPEQPKQPWEQSFFESDIALNFAQDAQPLEWKDESGITHIYTPDVTRGYFSFECSFGFPFGVTAYGLGILPSVVAKSHQSLLHQNLNREHRMRIYSKEDNKQQQDSIIGNVVAVTYPKDPVGGWSKLPKKLDEAPRIRGVASYAKVASGVKEILGEHLAGRHKYAVSTEIFWRHGDSGFIFPAGRDPEFKSTTPEWLAREGYQYVPWNAAPQKLQGVYDIKRKRIVKTYNSMSPIILKGGLDGVVHYGGLAVVKFGAESTANIQLMAASGTRNMAAINVLAKALGDFATELESAVKKEK